MTYQQATVRAESAVAIPHAYQIEMLISEIASIADRTERECYLTSGDQVADRKSEEVDLQLDRLRNVIQQVGLLADMATEALGHEGLRGGFEAWMMPHVLQPRV